MLTVILLPGMDGTGILFSPFTDLFPDDWKIRVVGYPNDPEAGYKELEIQIQKLIPDTGQYILLGESFSGPLAISLAKHSDDRLTALILCCTFVKNPIQFGSSAMAFLAKFPLSFVPKPLLEKFLLGRFRTHELAKLLHKTLKKVSTKTIVKRIHEVQDIDVSESLSEIKVPTLYLRASDDNIVSSKASELIVSINPAIQISEVEGPHCLLQASPQSALQSILEFMTAQKQS